MLKTEDGNLEALAEENPLTDETEVSDRRQVILDAVAAKEQEFQANEEKASLADTSPIDAPKSWTKEQQDSFALLPRHIQESLIQSETEKETKFASKSKEIEQLERRYRELDDVIAPHRERLAMEQTTPAQLVNKLLAAQDVLNRDPIAGITHLCRIYGVHPMHLMQNVAQQPQMSPDTIRLQTQLAAMQQNLAQISEQAERQKRASAEMTSLSFIEAKDKNGQPLHPYAIDVVEDMANRINFLRTSGITNEHTLLKKAYEEAVWANPNTRAKLLAGEKLNDAYKTTTKKISTSLSGGPGMNSTASLPTDRRELIRHLIENHS